MSEKIELRKLSLQKGDILVIERSFGTPVDWNKLLNEAGKEAGIDFSVPFIFVDDIDSIAVVRLGERCGRIQTSDS